MIDLRQLRSFVRVARSASMTQAAAVLGVSQPALSRQIRLLEAAVGARLLVRHGRGVALTAAGELLAERGERVLGEVEELRRAVSAQAPRHALSGTVAIGLSAAASRFLAEPLAARCRSLHPALALRFIEGFSIYLHEWLLSGSIDLAIIYGRSSGPGFAGVELLVEDLVAVGAATAKNRARKAFSPGELANVRLILPHRPHLIRELVEAAGIRPRMLTEIDSHAGMVEHAQGGAGYALVPASAVMREVAAGQLVAIPIDPAISWTVSVCHSTLQQPRPEVIATLELLRKEARRLVRSGRWPGRFPGRGGPRIQNHRWARPSALVASVGKLRS